MLGILYTLQRIAEMALAQDLFQAYPQSPPIKYVSFDSRTITYGAETLFVAIKTEHRDGHDFLKEAFDKGVRNFLVDRPISLSPCNYILSKNTLEALQIWAMHHRQQFSYPVIGITGSNGKTTVKEWLATLLEWEFDVVKSPMSYNSQIGVPLSVLQMHPKASCAIIEAGISHPQEMEILREIIQPTIGILTHMGDAHDKAFDSFQQKLAEKCHLFAEVDQVLCGSGQTPVWEYVQNEFPQALAVGEREIDEFRLQRNGQDKSGMKLLLERGQTQLAIDVPFAGDASWENISLALSAALYLGLSTEGMKAQSRKLLPVRMRCEIITDNPDITVLNDSYNSDLESARTALHLLNDIDSQPQKVLILTDMKQQGAKALERHKEIYQEAIQLLGEEKVLTIGPIFGKIAPSYNYPHTDAFIRTFRYEDFIHHTVLIKGARSFRLERLLPLLNRKPNASYFQIDLDDLVHNFKTLCARVAPGTQTMCVVKASSYGNGTWEIARELADAGADYLAVAYTSEGIALRESQIQLPIMVMNPNKESIPSLIQYRLQPEISNLDFLEAYIKEARLSEWTSYPLHLKLETGMGRLGFKEKHLFQLCAFLVQEPRVQIVSMLSHLAAADDPREDEFSHQQVQAFKALTGYISEQIGFMPPRHILNSKGVLRFPTYAFEMVRLGAGLYGINTTDVQSDLVEIGGLYSTISQIQEHPSGVSIGYGRAQYTERPSRIATVALGYADGIPRNLSCGAYSFLVRGMPAPIFGRVCMDMTMIDVTDIPEATMGDEVAIFGSQRGQFLSVEEMAKQAQTIPYEILVRISPRVRRIYMKGR